MSAIGRILFLILAAGLTACAKRPVIKAIHPAKAEVESTVTTINSGTVDADQQAVLNFGTLGRVAKIQVHLGDEVKQGQVLATQENTDLKLIFQQAEKEYGRARQLFDDKLVSRVAFDDARKALEVARANYDKSVIAAPFDGIITELNLRLGEQAGGTSAKTLMRIVDLKPRLVKGDIDEVDLAKVKAGQKARVRVPAARETAFAAQVSRVIPFIDTTKEQDRTSQIELMMTDANKTVPVGASAEIEIVTGEKSGVLSLPTRIILGSGGQRYVFLVRDGRLVKQPVKAGMGNYDRTEILSGLSESDVVAYPSDAVSLEDGLRVQAEIDPWP